jgi:Transglutaminase-like superfamily
MVINVGGMANLLVRLWRMPPRRKLALAEAFVGTALAWALIRLAPYALWRASLGAPVPLQAEPMTGRSARASGDRVLQDIAWAHVWLARLFKTRFTCLMLALSARGMLRRRGMTSVLVLGVKRGAERDNRLGAHAWILSRGYEIVGGDTRDGHVPVAAYQDRSALVSLGAG